MTEKCLIIFLVSFLFFLKSICYKYTSDDIPVSQLPKTWDNKFQKRFMQFIGSIRVNPQEDHLLTTIIHSFVCVLVYLAFGATDVSFYAALLFCLNPINNQGSVWISGRGYVLSTMLILFALTFPVLSPVFIYLASLFNVGYVALFVFIGSPYPWTLWFIPFIWLINLKKFSGDVKQKFVQESFDEDKKIHPKKLMLYVKSFGFYCIHALIPIKTTFYHSYLQSLAGSGKERGYCLRDRFFWLGIALLSGIGYYWICFTWNIYSFALLWWVIGISPFCNLFRMNQEIAERYAYFPTAGLMVALAGILTQNTSILAFFLGMYATKLWVYMDCFTDDYYLTETATLNSPDSWYAWHTKALRRWTVQSYREAVILWTMAKIISPKEFKILFNLATMLKMMNLTKEAEAFLAEAEKNVPPGQEKQSEEYFKNWREGKMAILQ